MKNRTLWSVSTVAALALVAACGKQPSTPSSPTSAAAAANTNANPDGSLLKASAPTPQSPINGEKPPAGSPVTLVVGNSTTSFAAGVAPQLSYEFELTNAGGAVVYTATQASGAASTPHTVTATLQGEQTYQWRARARLNNVSGPWSARASFVAPLNDGYIRGNEMYDPLINGKTAGVPHGSIDFIAGVGARLNDLTSYISYELPQTLFEGEFSLLVTNMPANTKGGKTKLFAMGKGYDDVVTNEYRMTIEKRGDPPGLIAWRFIARDDQVDTEGPERAYYNFQANLTYFFQATWRANRFNLLIREGGANGTTIYDYGKHWDGRGYEPSPHVLYLGAPVGRSGPDGASVQGAIIRQVWVSGNPRPGFANQ